MKTLMRRTLYALGGLLALLVLFHVVENWRGNRAWAAWQKEQEAEGYRFDRTSYVPPAVPDDENFAAIPRIAAAIQGTHPLLTLPANWPDWKADWREARHMDLEAYAAAFPGGDVPKGLGSYQKVLDEVGMAAARPGCRLAIDYAHFPDDLQVPNLSGFRAAGRMLQFRALAALRDGRNEAAFQDVTTLLRMANHFEREPILLCQLLHMALANLALQPIWEGMDAHAWTDPQLAELQEMLAKTDFLASLDRSWRLEQAGMSALWLQVAGEAPWAWTPYPNSSLDGSSRPGHVMAFLRHLAIPRGWILQNAVRGSRGIQEIVSDPLEIAAHRIDPRRQEAALMVHSKSGSNPYTFLVSDLGPALAAQNIRAARFQMDFAHAWIACELERYRRARHAFPEQLAEIGTHIPSDVIGGNPLHYRRTQDGGYVLYSLGWNGTDEGGQIGHGKDAIREGDWVWAIHGVPSSHLGVGARLAHRKLGSGPS
ncbi:hypothetical protein [Geothrix fuzhouensis]|uniref:hypothetical protein n=1 Tax=Geothrix fuzhouensis TaxID=2966451 RepID=UPI0021485E28|nr:hypothetical protein [Geothrix fuzhouensis]